MSNTVETGWGYREGETRRVYGGSERKEQWRLSNDEWERWEFRICFDGVSSGDQSSSERGSDLLQRQVMSNKSFAALMAPSSGVLKSEFVFSVLFSRPVLFA